MPTSTARAPSAKARALEPPTAALESPTAALEPPIIFLDIDGVVHPLASSGHALLVPMEELTRRADAELLQASEDAIGEVLEGEFVPACMRPLAACAAAVGAKLVLSSTWRETPAQRRAVDRQLIAWGMPATCDATPQLRGAGRSAEVRAWVDANRPSRWVCIDDQELLSLPPEHYVRTDAASGFTEADAAIVCTLLGTAASPERRSAPPSSDL